jgi:hypothetical protein
MKAIVNTRHPRIAENGSPCNIPLCIDTGSFGWNDGKELNVFDELGIAVSTYFKLLKIYILFFLVCTVICIPLFYLYSSGNMS